MNKEQVKKAGKIISIFSLLIVSLIIFTKYGNDIDEFHNYNFARNIATGRVIYKDFNCVVFPGFPLVLGLIIKIFGEQVFVYRIFQIAIIIITELLIFKLLDNLKVSNKSILTSFGVLAYIVLLANFALVEYNFFAVMIILIIMNIEQKETKSVLDYILLGLLTGIVTTVKQSIGFFILISEILNTFIDKENIKNKIKNLFIKLIPFGTILGIMILYLYQKGAFYEFLDYTILGLRKFTANKYTYLQFLIHGNFLVAIISFAMIIGEIYNVITTIKTKDKVAIRLLIFSFGTLIPIVYPIANEYHILIGWLPSFILLIYLINKNRKSKEYSEKLINNLSKTIMIFIIVLSIILVIYLVLLFKRTRKYKHYYGIDFNDEIDSELGDVTNFINENPNTYIISCLDCFYMIPVDRYNGVLDLINVGNTGVKGEQVIIDKINKMENVYLLINISETKPPTQAPTKAIEYVQNFEYKGDVGRFKIYYKK